MNKAVSWNRNDAAFDAREAARDAARREGKSLGEWLHGVIAERAAEAGTDDRDLAGRDRVEAVADRLDRMSGAIAADTARARPQWGGRRRANRASYAEDDHPPRPHRSMPASSDEMDYLLDEAVDAFERRAARSEQKTDAALASLAKMLETNEARRDQERAAVTILSQKLNSIETKLTDKGAESDTNPIKGALARLEARLDAIGRRGAAEAGVKSNVEKTADKSELLRLDDKLNSILDAISGRPASPAPETSTHAIAAALPAPHQSATRRLGDAIAEIGRRQRHLEDPHAGPVMPWSRETARRPAVAAIPARDQSPQDSTPRDSAPRDDTPRDSAALASVQAQIAALATKIEDMSRDLRDERAIDRSSKSAARESIEAVDFKAMHEEIRKVSRGMSQLAPRESVLALHDAMKALDERIDVPREQDRDPLDQMVRDQALRDQALRDQALRDQALRDQALRDQALRDLALRDEGLRDAVVRPVERLVGDVRQALSAQGPRYLHLQEQMDDIRRLLADNTARPAALETIETRVAELGERIERQAFHPNVGHELGAVTDALRAMLVAGPASTTLHAIEDRLDQLAGKLDATVDLARRSARDEAQAALDPARFEPVLEHMIRDLSDKIEATQRPGPDNGAMAALQRQVEMLSARFERSEHGLASLSSLEASMHDLFQHLEATRATVETTAARAASEVLRIAADGAPRGDQPDVATLKALQRDADERTQSTLNAVHETLEKVVDRLSLMEHDIADVRDRSSATSRPDARPEAPVVATAPAARPFAPPPHAGAKAPPGAAPASQSARSSRPVVGGLDIALGAADQLFDSPAAGQADRARKGQNGARSKIGDLEDGSGRADFIAAARRAAKAAQNDPSVLAMKRPVSEDEKAARAGLLARSRDFVATHKRPVLLSIAALFVIFGTMALVQRFTVEGNESVAIADAATAVTRMAEPSPQPFGAKIAARDDLSPSALPVTAMPSASMPKDATRAGDARPLSQPIPGSDPIQTGSITSLPSFAQSMPAPAHRPLVPTALAAMAASGDAAAQYELGSRYADGLGAPRDFKLAAQWYAKAADQGSAPARYRLASLYEKGLGVPLDKAKAKSLYLQSADAGNPRAMHNLAVLLADGDGSPDYTGAALWFRKAAQYGVHDSQYNLAILLGRGLGVPQSLVQSYQWFAIAAQANDADAAKKRDEVAIKLDPNDLAVAKALAGSFRPKVAESAATEVTPPPGGWDGVRAPSPLNSARSKISSL